MKCQLQHLLTMRFGKVTEQYLPCSVKGHNGPFRVVLRMLRWWGVAAEEGGIVSSDADEGLKPRFFTVRSLEKSSVSCRHSGHLTPWIFAGL